MGEFHDMYTMGYFSCLFEKANCACVGVSFTLMAT